MASPGTNRSGKAVDYHGAIATAEIGKQVISSMRMQLDIFKFARELLKEEK